MNWTSAVTNNGENLAKLSTLDEVCDAQTYIRDPKHEFWTALRLTADGKCQWGLDNSSNLENCNELFEEAQPDQCYIIRKYPMKLQPRICNSSKSELHLYCDGPGK